MDNDATEPKPPCPQAWHGGLAVGLLRECKYHAGHRGMHRNASGTLEWGGKLTEREHQLATLLREEAREAEQRALTQPQP